MITLWPTVVGIVLDMCGNPHVLMNVWYSGVNKYLIHCQYFKVSHLQRMERSVIFIEGTPQLWKTVSKKTHCMISILLHETSIWYNRKIELNIWYRKLCLQLQRSDISCSSWPGFHTLQEGFWPTPPYRSSLDISGLGAVSGQHGASAPSKDFWLGSGLETG